MKTSFGPNFIEKFTSHYSQHNTNTNNINNQFIQFNQINQKQQKIDYRPQNQFNYSYRNCNEEMMYSNNSNNVNSDSIGFSYPNHKLTQELNQNNFPGKYQFNHHLNYGHINQTGTYYIQAYDSNNNSYKANNYGFYDRNFN